MHIQYKTSFIPSRAHTPYGNVVMQSRHKSGVCTQAGTARINDSIITNVQGIADP